MSQTPDDVVLYDVSEQVALLTLNRPERMNGWTREMELRYFGLPAEFEVSWLLPRLIGYGNALDLLLSGRAIDADEAFEMGLVQRLFAPEELLPGAREYARNLAANCAPSAMAAIKAQMVADWTRSHAESLAEASELVLEPRRRADFAEGVAAYVEHRPARFRPLPTREEWA